MTFNTEELGDAELLEAGLPFTSEVATALAPNSSTLLGIIARQKDLVETVPVLQFLRSKRWALTRPVPDSGGLSKDDLARINNWFTEELKDKEGNNVPAKNWALLAPVAHARTLLLAYRMRTEQPDINSADTSDSAWLDRAWSRQIDKHDSTPSVDVDREAISALEARMFAQSAEAGVAGNCQWGLDTGPHQDNWYPYIHGPESWTENARVGLESELEVSRSLQYFGCEGLPLNLQTGPDYETPVAETRAKRKAEDDEAGPKKDYPKPRRIGKKRKL